jgi:hypothetical protein
VEQELPTLPEHLSSPPVFSGIHVTRSLVLYVCFVDRCLFFCTFSFGHCIGYKPGDKSVTGTIYLIWEISWSKLLLTTATRDKFINFKIRALMNLLRNIGWLVLFVMCLNVDFLNQFIGNNVFFKYSSTLKSCNAFCN